ncbi:MAG: CotH kinase family protein [Bacilli bacterium]
MNHTSKYPLILGAFFFLVLTSCEGIISSSQPILNSETIADYQTQLSPQVPYINDHLLLPTTIASDPNLNIEWSTPDYVIEEGVFQYVSPIEDEMITLTATLTKQDFQTSFTYPILVKSQLHVPTITKGPILKINLANSKNESDIFYEDYINATAVIQYDLHGQSVSKNISSPLGIRTRGHSTRFMPKRPYRIRFDENTSILGMKSAKNYILLANYIDRSLVRNSLTAYMSQYFPDTLYSLDYRFVDLFINQSYRGQYLLIERVEFSKNRLDIEPNLTLDDAGFMIELDYQVYVQNQGNENLEWFRINDRPYAIKEPNPLGPGYQFRHTRFINNYLTATRQALIQKQNYDTYLDVENWIDYFMIQEIAKNVDVGWGSVYMVKESGGKIKHMPLWDFDLAYGNADYIDYGPEGHWGWATYEKNELFTLMMQVPAIKTRFKQKLLQFEETVLPAAIAWLDDNEERLITLSEDNFTIWPMNQCEGWCPIPEPLRPYTSISQQFDYLRNFLTQRVSWMKSHI